MEPFPNISQVAKSHQTGTRNLQDLSKVAVNSAAVKMLGARHG